jgi:hypothetical protein
VNIVLVVIGAVKVDDESQVGNVETSRSDGSAHKHVDHARLVIPESGLERDDEDGGQQT